MDRPKDNIEVVKDLIEQVEDSIVEKSIDEVKDSIVES